MVADVTNCSKCMAEILPDDSYCQECGAELTKGTESNRQQVFHALVIGSNGRVPIVMRPVLDLSIWFLLLMFFGLLIWWLVDLERSHSPFSLKEALIQAQAAVATGRLDEAVHIMERISLVSAGHLSDEERCVLNETFYGRARTYAEKHNYRLALADLLRISPEFMHYEDARKKVRTYSSLAQAEMQSTRNELTSNAVHLSWKRGHRARSEAGETPALPRVTNLDSSKGNGIEPESQGTTHQDQATVGDDVIGGGSSLLPRVGGGTSGAKPMRRWNYTDDDIAQYHKLLADYFSVSHLGTRRTENLGVVAENREPPTFKEWLDSGKPDF